MIFSPPRFPGWVFTLLFGVVGLLFANNQARASCGDYSKHGNSNHQDSFGLPFSPVHQDSPDNREGCSSHPDENPLAIVPIELEEQDSGMDTSGKDSSHKAGCLGMLIPLNDLLDQILIALLPDRPPRS